MKNIKNSEIRNLFSQMNIMNEHSKELSIIYGIFGHLYSGSSKKGKAPPSNDKPESIRTTFDQIFPILEDFAMIQSTASGIVSIPLIFSKGSGILNIQNYFEVCFETTKYEFGIFSYALEILLKIYILFHIEFPKPSKQVFEFLCNYFFDFNYDLSPKAKALIDEINDS